MYAFGLFPVEPWLKRQQQRAVDGLSWSPIGKEFCLLYGNNRFNWDSVPKAWLKTDVVQSYRQENLSSWAMTAYSDKPVVLSEASEAATKATARYKRLWHPMYTSGTGKQYKWKKATRDSQTTAMETMAHKNFIDEYAYLRSLTNFDGQHDELTIKGEALPRASLACLRSQMQRSPPRNLQCAQPPFTPTRAKTHSPHEADQG